MNDRLNSVFFITDTDETLRFTEHYTWAVVGSLVEFRCDEDTECPLYGDGVPVRGSFVRV